MPSAPSSQRWYVAFHRCSFRNPLGSVCGELLPRCQGCKHWPSSLVALVLPLCWFASNLRFKVASKNTVATSVLDSQHGSLATVYGASAMRFAGAQRVAWFASSKTAWRSILSQLQ
jgi:hypothetical protein